MNNGALLFPAILGAIAVIMGPPMLIAPERVAHWNDTTGPKWVQHFGLFLPGAKYTKVRMYIAGALLVIVGGFVLAGTLPYVF